MKKYILSIFAASALLFSSCDNMLDVQPQGGSVTDEMLQDLVKKDADKVLAPMLLGMIDYIHTGYYYSDVNGRGILNWNLGMDFQGNDMLITDVTNWWKTEYTFNNIREQVSSYAASPWYCYYKMVYKANQILDLIPADATGKAAVYKAQCLTYRALAYYYLLNIYQDAYIHGGKDKAGVPLYLSTGDPTSGRAPMKDVYTQITTDLQNAITIFTTEKVDTFASVTDIDATVANMVLARVAVSSEQYDIAIAAAKAVIDAGYTLMNENEYTTSGFQSASLPETIWAYTWSQASSLENRSFASWISKTAIDDGSNQGIYVLIDNQLYDQIPDTDYRKKNFTSEVTTATSADGTKTFTYPKYTNTKFDTATFRQDEVYMRLSEAYLLKAEAEARATQYSAAQQTLFDLVSKRDSGYTKSTKTGDALLKEIHLQSRIELWGEGHEWFTNKRFNVGVDRTASSNHIHKVKIAAGKDFTYQIPLSIEINSNPYITDADQNPL